MVLLHTAGISRYNKAHSGVNNAQEAPCETDRVDRSVKKGVESERSWVVEFYFHLGRKENRIAIRKQFSQRYNSLCKDRRLKDLINAIVCVGKSHLVFVTNSLTGQHYVQEILEQRAIPFLSFQRETLFLQDKAQLSSY
ncbi:hypothetical protein TNCV_1016721 [Trichonephila clavipes]|uniref:Uncharacterized protein n=1 Tax=Trichonephila clavipes TaxID=2585209 RepID=A0A8X6VYF1_TRICX|nr:hypothetical protein TNCV_1016721 [Trichonephila clavipes]